MKSFNTAIGFHEFEASLGLGITFPCRSTLVDLGNRRALMISPGPMDPEIQVDIRSKYDEIAFVAPNSFHHLYLEKTRDLFPNSKIYAPPSIYKKRKRLRDEFTPSDELGAFLKGVLEPISLEGNPTLDETAFWHPRSKTLILTDLFFHMKEPMPRMRRWVLKMAGAYDKVGQSKLIKLITKDKAKFRESIRRLVDLGPESIVIAHGDLILGSERCQEVLNSL